MRLYFIVMSFVCFLIGQQKVIIYVGNETTHLQAFEREFMLEVFRLYNQNQNETLEPEFRVVGAFKEHFSSLDSLNHFICSIDGISKTKERQLRFDFSEHYLPLKGAIISFSGDTTYMLSGKRIGVTEGGLYEEVLKDIWLRGNSVKYPNSKEMVKALLIRKEIDFFIDDIIRAFSYNELKVVQIIDHPLINHYSIMFPKGSKLRTQIAPYLTYLRRSAQFYKLLSKYFREENLEFFRKAFTKMDLDG